MLVLTKAKTSGDPTWLESTVTLTEVRPKDHLWRGEVLLIPCHLLTLSSPGTAHCLFISQPISTLQTFPFILSLSHSLRYPCPVSYHLFPGGSNVYSQALSLVMLLSRCTDMPEFALILEPSFQNEMFFFLIYSSGLCLSILAPASCFYFSLILLLLMCYFQYLNNHHPL